MGDTAGVPYGYTPEPGQGRHLPLPHTSIARRVRSAVSRGGRGAARLGLMATRTGRPSARQTSPVLSALQWVWAGLLSLVLILSGLALVGGGLLFTVVGAQAVLEPDDAGHAVAGVLFAVLGLAAAVGGIALVFRWRSRLVLRLSGRKPPSLGGNDGGGYVGGGFFGGDGGGGCGGGDGGGGGGSC